MCDVPLSHKGLLSLAGRGGLTQHEPAANLQQGPTIFNELSTSALMSQTCSTGESGSPLVIVT